MTHCDKKTRGKVGGSAISVYQALLHPHTESLGTRLSNYVFEQIYCNKQKKVAGLFYFDGFFYTQYIIILASSLHALECLD